MKDKIKAIEAAVKAAVKEFTGTKIALEALCALVSASMWQDARRSAKKKIRTEKRLPRRLEKAKERVIAAEAAVADAATDEKKKAAADAALDEAKAKLDRCDLALKDSLNNSLRTCTTYASYRDEAKASLESARCAYLKLLKSGAKVPDKVMALAKKLGL